MYAKSTFVVSVFVAVAHARFDQENAVQGIINAIGGNNGQAATLAGASIGTLLAASNACAKLSLADQVAALIGAGALDAAKALVQAEKNFNPFVVSIPSFCSDPTLPATASLRGILPLVDPSIAGAAAQNAASAASLKNPVNANGLSVADIVKAQGLVSFTPQSNVGVVGAEVSAGGAVGDAAASPANTAVAAAAATTTAAAAAATNGAATNTTAASSTNLQTFTGALGAAADAITFSGDVKRPFEVNGNLFVQFAAAAARTCDIQFNACADAANSGKQGIAFAACNTQKDACMAAQVAATTTSFSTVSTFSVTNPPPGTDASLSGTDATNPPPGGASDSTACQSSRLKKREEAQKRAEKSKRMALIRTIIQKRAELTILEELLL